MDYFSTTASASTSSFTNSTSAYDIVSSFASFWNQISGTIAWSDSLFSSYYFTFKKEVVDLAPTEKNMLDYPRGKLRMPKPVCPRGFKHLALRHEFSGPHFK